MATSAATACAVAALSPVSIHTSRPSAFSWATAPAESGLTGSATTIRPTASASTAANIGVWPAAAAWLACGVSAVTSMPASVRSAALPTRTRRPSTVASMPRPGMAVKRSTGGSARPRSRAAVTIAAPSGCSLPVSAAATIASRDAASHWPAVWIRVTAGRPWVIVPVLSRTIAVSRRDCSSASPLPIRTPSSAALPVPTMTAVGVARPSAQGQAMISTAMAVPIAMVQWLPADPARAQTVNVATAAMRTPGTNHAETVSARRCIGGLAPCASSTSRTICARAVSWPTAVARNKNAPVPLMVAPMTWSPGALSTGALSPVSMLSSIVDTPSTMIPSTGIFSPGRTRTTSAVRTSSTGMSCSLPSRITRAVFGASPTSSAMAAAVRFLARSSIHRPIRIKAMITREVSKYRCSGSPARSAMPGHRVTKAL